MNVRSNTLLGVLSLLLGLLSLGVAVKAERGPILQAEPQVNFSLSVDKGMMSLKAENSSLKVVLEAIGQKMNIEVLGEIQDGETITTEFNRLPLAEALERLSPNYGYQMRTEKGERKISRIFVLPKPQGFIRPKPVVQDPQLVEPSASPDLAVAERPDKPVPSKKNDGPDKEKSARSDPFKFEFDPSAFIGKGP